MRSPRLALTRENIPRFSRDEIALRDTVLHTLHLQQTAGDPRRSLSSLGLPSAPPRSLSHGQPLFSAFVPSRSRYFSRARDRLPVPPARSAERAEIPDRRRIQIDYFGIKRRKKKKKEGTNLFRNEFLNVLLLERTKRFAFTAFPFSSRFSFPLLFQSLTLGSLFRVFENASLKTVYT